ncbi:pilus assembly FimT family protein [Thalassoglobus sp.]|uniref:pilus assembly FimT family protein n=1 Tax=Thalassoglobus sp. TaxID=2795869 RepID=UPI003AA9C011
MHQHRRVQTVDCPRGRRSAFTVLELILVLAVIVAIAGISWPRMSGFLKRESVMGNVEQVRQVLDHARVQAVEDGITYQFRFEPNGRKYVLLPYDLQVHADEQASASQTLQGAGAGSIKLAMTHELSEDCQFYMPTTLISDQPMILERLPEAWLKMVQNGVQHRDVSWSAPILFFADGSATTGAVTVVDEDKRYITVSVRGLTGAVVTSRISQLPELFGGSSN